MRKRVPLLKDHAQLLSELVPVGAFRVDIDIVDDDSSLLNIFDGIDAVEQRRFAAAAAADDTDHFTSVHFQVDPLQNLQVTEGFMHVLNLDHIAIFLSTYLPYRESG